MTDYLCVTLEIRVHQPGWDKRLISRTPLFRYFIGQYLKSFIHYLAFDTIHDRLPLDSFRHLGPCPRVGLESKSKDILVFHLFFKKYHLYLNNMFFLFVTSHVRVHDPRWG